MTLWYPQCRATLAVVFDSFGGTDSDPTVLDVLPKASSVHVNSYREADTWELTFDAKDLPFSPEIVRALGVEIYLFTTDALDYNPNKYATAQNMLVAGLADNATLTISGDGREFRCDGRDYTAILIDRQWDPREKIRAGRDLQDTVQALVDAAITPNTAAKNLAGKTPRNATPPVKIGGRTLTVKWESEKDIPVVGKVGQSVTKKKAPVGGAPVVTPQGSAGKGIVVKSDQSYWDVIYKLVLSYGFIVFIRGWDVVITTPRCLTAQNQTKAKKVAYGYNLASLEVERKLGKEKVPQIRVTAYDSKTRKPITAVYPAKRDKTTTGIGTKQEEVQNVVIHEPVDLPRLKQIAQCRYDSQARGEGTIRFMTKSLSSLTSTSEADKTATDVYQAAESGKTKTSDLLQLRAGDPVSIGFDPFNDVEMRKLDIPSRYECLRRLGYSVDLSNLVALEYDKIAQFDRPFYVREVNFTWGHKDGITIDCEAINFVSVERDDPEAVKPNQTATKGSRK